jgi:hypothetical protein
LRRNNYLGGGGRSFDQQAGVRTGRRILLILPFELSHGNNGGLADDLEGKVFPGKGFWPLPLGGVITFVVFEGDEFLPAISE